LHFGYADRIRYYWPHPDAKIAVDALFDDLETLEVSQPMKEQYFAPEVLSRAQMIGAKADSWPRALVWAQIQVALAPYLFGKPL